jgi:hypothetical protein
MHRRGSISTAFVRRAGCNQQPPIRSTTIVILHDTIPAQLLHCLLLALLLISSPGAAETLTGRVVGVTNGDTIKMLVGERNEYGL